ncbi:hypothetical protein Pyn_05927 [Prunus yedoensis var. nudiflora]|uniref:Uncharacterized protein n=1 Tax=Prunus yedoensis var. nudiflora TaxID=2094558 RepID=A0A314XUQ8_PRUYE|nr:hypothetical protein Pyn_05927 [Prunus yedoensis var. nudiflora]
MELSQLWLLANKLGYKHYLHDITGRPQTAKRAIEQVEQRLSKDGWPEYYDGKAGRYVEKEARKYQT